MGAAAHCRRFGSASRSFYPVGDACPFSGFGRCRWRAAEQHAQTHRFARFPAQHGGLTEFAGERIALVGPTGAGKSTVINLLCRFYDIEQGRITIDGYPVDAVTLDSLRTQMGIMLQDPFLFPGTVMDNIRYGRLDASDEACIEAARAVHAHPFIMRLSNGYQTQINDQGSGVSAGERQLISFARVLLADPHILILDEATASIDTQTEKALQQGLDRLMVGRTSFIIAHRLSTIKNVTRIMVVADGKIAQSGTHAELVRQPGHYQQLYLSQFEALLGRDLS